MSILVSGSLVYDHIMDFPDSFKNHIMPDRLHILNVCFVVNKLERSWGGTAGNISFTMKLLGAEPLLVSAVGKDGGDYLRHFEQFHISAEYIAKDDAEHTASCYITTDKDDNQITAFYGGPLGASAHHSLKDRLRTRPALAIVSPTDKRVMISHLKECKEMGMTTVFDPGQQITAFSGEELRQMIGQSDFVIGNDYEITLLEERTKWTERDIVQRSAYVIITRGAQGSIIKTAQGDTIEAPICPPEKVADPTGAGDAYRAGFFTGYEKQFDLLTCARMGAVAASYAIEIYGTQAHRFTQKEFCERYRRAFGEVLAL